MKGPSTLRQRLSSVSRLWKQQKYDKALAEVESLRGDWPGNAHLCVLWASLVQLQEDPQHTLAEVKEALKQAVELDEGSPAAAIELAQYLDHVEDDPEEASGLYADAVAGARQLLMDALIGQAKVFRQLSRRDELHRCLLEILLLSRFEGGARESRRAGSGVDLILDSSAGDFHLIQFKGQYPAPIQELLDEVAAGRPA